MCVCVCVFQKSRGIVREIQEQLMKTKIAELRYGWTCVVLSVIDNLDWMRWLKIMSGVTCRLQIVEVGKSIGVERAGILFVVWGCGVGDVRDTVVIMMAILT